VFGPERVNQENSQYIQLDFFKPDDTTGYDINVKDTVVIAVFIWVKIVGEIFSNVSINSILYTCIHTT